MRRFASSSTPMRQVRPVCPCGSSTAFISGKRLTRFLRTSSLSKTDYRDIRIPLISGLPTLLNSVYWLVFEYVDATGIDADNFVQWRYGPLPGGGARAYHDGVSWTVVPDESHDYKLYGDDLVIRDDFTISILTWRPTPMNEANLISFNGVDRELIAIWENKGTIRANYKDEIGRTFALQKPADLRDWSVITVTRSKDDLESLSVYQNGDLPRNVRRQWRRREYMARITRHGGQELFASLGQ